MTATQSSERTIGSNRRQVLSLSTLWLSETANTAAGHLMSLGQGKERCPRVNWLALDRPRSTASGADSGTQRQRFEGGWGIALRMHFVWTGARQRHYGGSTECFGPFTQQNGPLTSTTTHPAGLSPAPCQHPRPRPRPHRGQRRRQVHQLLPGVVE